MDTKFSQQLDEARFLRYRRLVIERMDDSRERKVKLKAIDARLDRVYREIERAA